MFERYREMQERRNDKESPEYGFTLIELLIVIIVLGILAAIVIFSLTGVTGQSKPLRATTDAKTVETAVSAYQAENTHSRPSPTLTTVDASGHGPYLSLGPRRRLQPTATPSASAPLASLA